MILVVILEVQCTSLVGFLNHSNASSMGVLVCLLKFRIAQTGQFMGMMKGAPQSGWNAVKMH